MNIERMNSIPSTREEFERNLFLMHELIKNDKFRICSTASMPIQSISRVRKLPNSRIDFLSVDEMARLQANSIANMEFMNRGSDQRTED